MLRLTKPWTEADIARLIVLADGGATLLRASAALGRNSTTVQKKARELKRSFAGAREVRQRLRASGAIDPRQ